MDTHWYSRTKVEDWNCLSYHSFSRSFRLPDSCEQEHIQARHADGVLHLEIPKKEEARRKAPRQIAIA